MLIMEQGERRVLDGGTRDIRFEIFGKLIYNPNLWHFNRHSVAKAFSVGLFFAWIPVPLTIFNPSLKILSLKECENKEC